MNSSPLAIALLTLGCVVLCACDKASPPAPAAGAVPEVTVVPAHSATLPQTRELVGRLAATRIAEVRARVAGIILERSYKEGSDVTAGQVLFRIDPAPLQAELHAQEATLAKAQADASNAQSVARRYRELHESKLISTQDLDTALASERSTAAAVKQAQANVEKARLDLGYATVTAPIAGRASRALVTEGALVGQGEATPLTTVEQIDPVYVNFSLPVSGMPARQEGTAATVAISLPDGTPYPQAGTLDYAGSAVDPGTGVVSLRAVVPNPDHALLPGMFVNLVLTAGTIDKAYRLPQATVSRDATGAYVMVVAANGKVEQRRVETHGMTATDWIVTGALSDGDQVILDGLQKVKPGGDAKAVAAGGTEH